uniref:Esterase / lipase n=1 Tax=Nannochloropsis gaditana (strain CCMP526) TaxID=1093141 RepID=I2CQR1_NANGC
MVYTDVLVDWAHLLYLVCFLTAAKAVGFFIVTVYAYFPFPALLDRFYLASQGLQSWFSYQLGGAAPGSAGKASPNGNRERLLAESLVEGTPFILETHTALTRDGFVLVLHRLVPKTSGQDGPGAPGQATSSSTSETYVEDRGPQRARSWRKASGENNGRKSGGGSQSLQQHIPTSSFFSKGPGSAAAPAVAPALPSAAVPTATGTGSNAVTPSTLRRPPLLMVHALMQDSESFLCGGEEHSLALVLAKAGFDVWLGNNRGNRYSHKHVSLSPSQDAYWNFSIDELARFDVPAMVDYVLRATGQEKLAYVGFSQGSAQAFAAFTTDLAMAKKVSIFLALAAPPRAKGLSSSYLSALVESNPRFIYLVFGRHSMLSSTLMWMKIMSPQLFVWTVDRATDFLFNWSNSQVSAARKVGLYQHIFSYASVKTVVQWFQLIRLRRLAFYSDDSNRNRVPVEYDLKRLRVPVAVFYGGKDTVIDISALRDVLPACIRWHMEPEYEHLDMIWADTAKDNVFPELVKLLHEYS